jgi:hypothetical protein
MQLLGRAKFLTEEKNPKGKVNFLKGANFLKGSQFPKGGDITRNFAPRGGGRNCRGGGRNSWDTGIICYSGKTLPDSTGTFIIITKPSGLR